MFRRCLVDSRQLAVFYYKVKGEELDNIIKRCLEFHSLWQVVLCVATLWLVSFAMMVNRWVSFSLFTVAVLLGLVSRKKEGEELTIYLGWSVVHQAQETGRRS